MRTTRFLLAALSLALAAACTAEPVGVVKADRQPSLDGTGWGGAGNSASPDTTFTLVSERCGVGVCGSGN